jgi:tellurite resistance protein
MSIDSSITKMKEALRDNPALEALRQARQHDERQAKLDREIVLGALAESVYIVAAADGSFSAGERTALASGLSGITDASESEFCELIDRVAPAVQEEGPSARFEEIGEVIDDPALREAAYLVACAVAWKDGGIGQKQGLALRGLKDAFGFSEAKHQQILAKARQLL